MNVLSVFLFHCVRVEYFDLVRQRLKKKKKGKRKRKEGPKVGLVWIVVNGQPGSETVALYLVIIYFTLPAFFFLPWFAGFRSEMIGGGGGSARRRQSIFVKSRKTNGVLPVTPN